MTREIYLARTWPRVASAIRWLTAPLYGQRIDAITTGFTVWYLTPEPSEALRMHEHTHVAQAQRMGRLIFALAYAWEFVRRGYRANRFEVEARKAAGQE